MLAEALGADVFANSPETADEIVRRNPGKIDRSRVTVFHNAAPSAFFAPRPPPSRRLGRLLIVSNHVPPELAEAAVLLRDYGIDVTEIGLGGARRRVTQEELAAVDAVITIGKTAVYGLASGTPVFLYDHFGGDGWLSPENLRLNLAHNFSGRPVHRRLTPSAILREVLEGYAAAVADAPQLQASLPPQTLCLDAHLSALRQRALTRPAGGAWALRWWMMQPAFRAHLEAVHWKSVAMARATAAAATR